jgi:NADPH:quinone reductase-like Zn-dependent oxidoreductase
MKAVVYTRYGPPEVLRLQEVEKPVPKDDEVLIKIHATTVNRTDCGFRKPEYGLIVRLFNGLWRPHKNILGSELSGEIEAIGKDVEEFKRGDPVFGLTTGRFGAHAEYICLPEKSSITIKPANTSFEEAAAVCDGLMMAMTFIRKIDLRRAKTILVNGASGSIGSACVQLAKSYGVTITAVCNTKNIELVRSLGAEKVIDYTKDDFTRGDEGYDVVIDAVGKSSYFRCKRLLKPGGIYFSTDLGFLAQNIFLALWSPVFSSKKVKFTIPKAGKKDIEFFRELIEAGKYRAVIDRRYPLEQIVEATRYVETGQKTGNVVITIP